MNSLALANAIARQVPPLRIRRVEVFDVSGADPESVRETGGWFLAGPGDVGDPRSWAGPFVLSPLHGRSVVIARPEGTFISLKGVGWTWGGPRVFASPKDRELTFGLLARRDADREVMVSAWLADRGLPGARVLGAARFAVVPAVGRPDDVLSDARWPDGSCIEPTLLYTLVRSPVRVADLPLMSGLLRKTAIEHAAHVMGWPARDLGRAFTSYLGYQVGALHAAGCVNDTLQADNVTVVGELLDFEWFTVPGIPLPDGTGTESMAARQGKEIVYALEIARLLGHVVLGGVLFSDLLSWLREGYVEGRGGPHPVFDQLAGDLSCRGTGSTMC